MFTHGECQRDFNYLMRSGNTSGSPQVCLDKVTGRLLCAELLQQNGLPAESKASRLGEPPYIRRTSSDGIIQLDCSSKHRKSRGFNGCCRKKTPLETPVRPGFPDCSNNNQQEQSNPDQTRHCKNCKGSKSNYRTRTFDWRRILKKSNSTDHSCGALLNPEVPKDLNQNTTWNRHRETLPAIRQTETCVRTSSGPVKNIARSIMSQEASSVGDNRTQSTETSPTRTASATSERVVAESCPTQPKSVSLAGNVSRKVSRLIQVDGVSYKVTMGKFIFQLNVGENLWFGDVSHPGLQRLGVLWGTD